MSTSRGAESRTARPTRSAQSAATGANAIVRVSLPPKPPPSRFVWHATRCCGSAHTAAHVACTFDGACVDE